MGALTSKVVYIRCSRQYSDEACKGCGSPRLRDVETVVLAEVRQYAAKLRGDVTAEATRLARAARAGADASALQRDLADTRKAMTRLATRWAREQAGDQVVEQAMAELRAAEEQLLAKLDQLRDVASGPPVAELLGLAERLIAMWDEMQPAERNQALRDVVDHVVINPSAYYRQPTADRVEVHWR